ncbi:hypothetical protein [Streptomyces sp. NPDC002573]|uniref:hypothetical protein n=1 Tax=Streptomyces sp. NPDC002573 TaxID=3364651 RepID=UPI0036A69A70
MREIGIGMRLGAEGVIPVSDPQHPSAGSDAVIDESQLEELIIEAQTALPFELSALANRCASALGLDAALIYLVDLQQQLLIPLEETLESLPVDDSLAGWAYRTVSPRVVDADGGVTARPPCRRRSRCRRGRDHGLACGHCRARRRRHRWRG